MVGLGTFNYNSARDLRGLGKCCQGQVRVRNLPWSSNDRTGGHDAPDDTIGFRFTVGCLVYID